MPERAALSTSWCAQSPWPKPLGQGAGPGVTPLSSSTQQAGPLVQHRTHRTCGEGPHVRCSVVVAVG